MAERTDRRGPATRPGPGADGFAVVAGRISRILGAVGPDTLGPAVTECLEEAGRQAEVDLAFAILTDADERITDDWRWSDLDRPLIAPELGSPLRDTFGSVTEILRLGHTIAVDDISTADLAPSERALATRNGLRAIVMAPVCVGGSLLGLIGFQVFDDTRHWERSTVNQLELVSELLLKAVVRVKDRGALAIADVRARRIAAHVPDGLVLVDTGGAITFASTSLVRAVEQPERDLLGTPLVDLVHPDDRPVLDGALLSRPEAGSNLVIRMRAGDRWAWSELSWRLAQDTEVGVPDEVVVSVRDVNERELEHRRLAQVRDVDPLTGALDRRGLERGIDRLTADGRSVVVAFLDVDRFKDVNDHHGHERGDEVLRTLAAALLATGPADALVARLGGDEFCVVAPVAPVGPGGDLGPDLLSAVGARVAAVVPSATVSIGVAGPGPAEEVGRLLAASDAAMYRAKRAGGGRWIADEAST